MLKRTKITLKNIENSNMIVLFKGLAKCLQDL